MLNRSFDEDVFDDCWVHVLCRLPLKKRIQLECVSPKWKRLMPYSDISSVHLMDLICLEDGMMKGEYAKPIVRMEDLRLVLMGVLSRCGHKLRCLVLRDTAKTNLHRFVFGLNGDLVDLLVEMAPDLVTLDLNNNTVLSLRCLPTLARLEKLEELLLGGVIFTEDDFSRLRDHAAIDRVLGYTIQNLPALKKFHLRRSSNVPPIHNAGLREVIMNAVSLRAAGVQDLVHHCPNLESLSMEIHNNPSDLQLGALGALHQLKNLHFSWGILRSGDLSAICRGCPKLEKLELGAVQELTSCSELWRLPHLKHLYICAQCPAIVDDAILASVAKYGLLETVKLPKVNLTDHGLCALTQCPNLITLDLWGIIAITDEGMKAVLKRCKHLEQLIVNGTSIGNGTMAAIGVNGVRLELVWADGTLVTDVGIRRLVVERGKRLVEGAQLVPLQVRVCCRCTVANVSCSCNVQWNLPPEEDLDAFNLTVIVSRRS